MSTLAEISVEYRKSAEAIKNRMRELRESDGVPEALKQTRVRDLRILYRETRGLAVALERYYEAGYRISSQLSCRKIEGGRRRLLTERVMWRMWTAHGAQSNAGQLSHAAELVQDSLEKLTERQREVIALLMQGHTQKDAAELLGVCPATVSRTTKRAIDTLRPLLAGCMLRQFDQEDTEAQLRETVRNAMDTVLTARQRDVVNLRVGSGNSTKDVARLLGVDHSVVSKTVRRAINKLVACCHGAGEEELVRCIEALARGQRGEQQGKKTKGERP